MRIAVTGGGTGGHVYPALAVAAALQQQPLNLPPQNILYFGAPRRDGGDAIGKGRFCLCAYQVCAGTGPQSPGRSSERSAYL